jgi:hypothetical protein
VTDFAVAPPAPALRELVEPVAGDPGVAHAPVRAVGGAQRLVEFSILGGGTLLLLPLCWWCESLLGLDEAELLIGLWTFHAASLVNDPHFAVTYLLFYKNVKERALGRALAPAQRVRYWIAGLVLPLILAGVAGVALAQSSAVVLGLLIQLMFFLVGFHYVKQGFGTLMVLSARDGVRYSRAERQLILMHCLAAWIYAWASPFDPGTQSVVQGVFYTTLGHPPGLEQVALFAFALSGLALAGMLARKRQREARWPPLAGLCGLLVAVWSWTVFSRLDPLLAYMIPALHSLQYLYFVWLLNRNVALTEQGPPTFKGSVRLRLSVLAGSATLLGWLLLRGVPAWLDDALVLHSRSDAVGMDLIGPTPYLAVFVTFVNIHHYAMDYVIWRREQPEMRHLRGPEAA